MRYFLHPDCNVFIKFLGRIYSQIRIKIFYKIAIGRKNAKKRLNYIGIGESFIFMKILRAKVGLFRFFFVPLCGSV